MKKINNSIEKLTPHLILVSILLIDILFLAGLIKVFFKGNSTIIAGVIAFIGAIIGGYITYLGVNKTLEHRDREVFLNDATEKLMHMEIFRDKYSAYLNAMFLYEPSIRENPKDKNLLDAVSNISKNLIKELKTDKEKMYKNMEYDAIEILSFHQKSLELSIRGKEFTEVEALNCIEKIRDVYQVFNLSKEKLESKYREYKKRD